MAEIAKKWIGRYGYSFDEAKCDRAAKVPESENNIEGEQQEDSGSVV